MTTPTQRRRLPEQKSGLGTTHPAAAPYPGYAAHVQTEDDIAEDESMYAVRMPNSCRRWNYPTTAPPIQQPIAPYAASIPPRRSALAQPVQTEEPRPRRRHHVLTWIGATMFIMLMGWVGLTALAHLWQIKMDDLTYGYPRTFQTDANVGHYGYVSHFVAINLKGKIEVIETEPQNPNQQQSTHLYIAANLATDQDLQPVTLRFENLTGSGRLDMLIFVGNSLQIPFYNNGTSFQTQPPSH